MKKKIIILLSIGLGLFFLIYLIDGLVWGLAMQPKPKSIELPKELDSLEKDIIKKYEMPEYNSVMNIIKGLDYLSLKDIEKCNKNKVEKRLVFGITISKIQNKKYFEEELMKKEADSLSNCLNLVLYSV